MLHVCSCGFHLNLKPELAGKWIRCPKCGSRTQVTAVPEPPPPRPAPDATSDTRPCPYCYEPVKVGAVKCRWCHETLNPAGAARVAQKIDRRKTRRPAVVRSNDAGLSPVDWILCILCPLIGCIVGLIALCQGQGKRGGIMIGVSLAIGVGVRLVILALKVGTTPS